MGNCIGLPNAAHGGGVWLSGGRSEGGGGGRATCTFCNRRVKRVILSLSLSLSTGHRRDTVGWLIDRSVGSGSGVTHTLYLSIA